VWLDLTQPPQPDREEHKTTLVLLVDSLNESLNPSIENVSETLDLAESFGDRKLWWHQLFGFFHWCLHDRQGLLPEEMGNPCDGPPPPVTITPPPIRPAEATGYSNSSWTE